MAQDKMEPDQGQTVTALTYPDRDRGLPPRRVTGVLQGRDVPVLGYHQLLVAGVPVDPKTVRRVKKR